MGRVKCPSCGKEAKRFGRTKAGSQRWRCLSCKATFTCAIDNTAKLLRLFLSWLLTGKTQDELTVSARTFRRKCSRFWSVWPLPSVTGEVHRIVFVDGIRIAKNVFVLIACTERHVIGWYLARSENSKSWGALMRKIPPPEVVVCDGGCGFEKARRKYWPQTRVQRCLFHAFCQVRKHTTTKPKLRAGAELYGIALALLHVKNLNDAAAWLVSFDAWCTRWKRFLSERTVNRETGRKEWTHERLVRARDGLTRLIKSGNLFTFLDPELTEEGPVPSTNNRLEGGINAQIRNMLRDHRGLSSLRRAKAAFWWCYMHSEDPLPAAEILKVMPTDDDIAEVYRRLVYEPQERDGPLEWGDGLVWAELHHTVDWRLDCN